MVDLGEKDKGKAVEREKLLSLKQVYRIKNVQTQMLRDCEMFNLRK